MKIIELRINIFGRVQGVNFRWQTVRFAKKNDIRGYVINNEEGSVFLVAQGRKEDLKNLLVWIQGNPGFSRVEGVDYRWKKPQIRYKEFSISRKGNYIKDKARGIFALSKSLLSAKINLNIPQHISIIPDGNRRWAKEKGLAASLGHYQAGSIDNLEPLINEARELGVKYISIWGFSTENWKREKKEIDAIFNLILKYLKNFEKDAMEQGIRFRHLGRKDRMPKPLVNELAKLEEETKENTGFNVQLCLDYGGRDEIVRTVNKILKNRNKKISEDDFSESLDSKGIPDVDLVIRTSGEKRTSGLMPFQSVYAELYFTEVYFPDFDAKELRKAVEEFSRRQRRFGGS